MIPVEGTVKAHFSFHLACESGCHFYVKQAHGAKRSAHLSHLIRKRDMAGQHDRPKEMKGTSRLSNVEAARKVNFQGYREVHLQNIVLFSFSYQENTDLLIRLGSVPLDA